MKNRTKKYTVLGTHYNYRLVLGCVFYNIDYIGLYERSMKSMYIIYIKKLYENI